ncbi:DUF2127 domain-containing protein [Mesobacterium pallidum]|uniref:DUF2127 domain-containing protein n=1 Tax=Mesobacterium pallidum TaxID=2872037 RepID=UPI001EE223F0|nr:DUF2127 domain-containing protein [Mesobacterium pallidum]
MRRDRLLELFFTLSLLGKGALGLTQLIGALGLWLAPASGLPRLIDWLTANELAQDPGDMVATHLRDWAAALSLQAEHFYIIYLLGHGALNFGVVLALLLRLPGAFTGSLVVLIGFVAYQAVTYVQTHDPALVVMTAIDVVVIALVLMEHRTKRSRDPA